MEKHIWFIGINLNGLWFEKAMQGIWDEKLKSWWHKGGNFNCNKTGLDISKRCIIFASYNKKDVNNFIKGVKAMGTLNKNLNHITFSK